MESYVVNARRQIHQYPEIGFDLDRTLAFLRSELDKMGVEYTDKYGKSSLVATINPEKTNFTIGIRADIDALPITEETGLPFASKIDGQMHACGHDAHAAIVLDTCRRLSEMRDKINCRVKIIFQAAEEYPPSGAKLMAEDGVMDEIDCIVALHVAPGKDVGDIAVLAGPENATSDGFHLEFYGKTAHAAAQNAGVDAIMMAVKAYTEIEFMIAKEIRAIDPIIFNVGAINGGVANNVICDHCSMYCTLRTHRKENEEYILDKIKKIIHSVAEVSGGRAEFVLDKHYPMVVNNETMVERIMHSAEKVIGKEHILPQVRGMGGEDFAYFANLKPGCMFQLGVRTPGTECAAGLHNSKMLVDERALDIGVNIFVQFVLDNMNGIDF
ncbi:MAG: amidohydrolase [Clostridia bacterium]|nr:amidohydrolase [Clostridia bacterium]